MHRARWQLLSPRCGNRLDLPEDSKPLDLPGCHRREGFQEIDPVGLPAENFRGESAGVVLSAAFRRIESGEGGIGS